MEDRRLDQPRLDEVRERVIDQLRPGLVVRRVDVPLAQLARSSSASRVQRPWSASASGSRTRCQRPRSIVWPLKLTVVVPSVSAATRATSALHPVHRVAVVGVGLVPLEHRELGVVLERDALVAEVLADLVDPLEAADDQPLEVELGGDAEVERLVELVVVRRERAGERPAVARLQDGRLDLDEAVLVERAADRADHARAELEVGARLLVHQQVEVAAAVALLDVGEAVERVGERRPDAGEDVEAVGRERRLAAPGLRGVARDAGDVAEVDVDLAGSLDRADQLDAPAAVDELEEGELAHVAAREDAAGEAALLCGFAAGLERLGLGPHGGDLVPVRKALRFHRRSA